LLGNTLLFSRVSHISSPALSISGSSVISRDIYANANHLHLILQYYGDNVKKRKDDFKRWCYFFNCILLMLLSRIDSMSDGNSRFAWESPFAIKARDNDEFF
jgi:hypothetical protein